ncbi:crotonase/enoyl-CoA hydratase family protein [Sphingobium phenoxybenzoativorans]|uniref:Crotonase/enoyl-CoA hydratase family protein n=1 Tax=Sphingobium phenoxybenzoativorans TaxID=1592790 RepID=A0A975Q1V2_9SPHN|nr:crotonase/enoyl-CoA hydratase family protein [Sphingobium phenoxybenzoativorans]QUT05773.1 crotonase/enoyl-CoA hydratase family protein [Sphingobium phenoxybenzoativorans]
MEQLVLIEIDGPVATLTLNNPKFYNPISDQEMVDALIAALAQIESDRDIRCAILMGAGRGFSAGGNLSKIGNPGELGGGAPVETPSGYKAGIQRIPLAFDAMEIPIIATVHGAAIGAGCDLACMCDIRIAGESASFAESFVKLGLIPGDGGAWLLPRAVGFSKACEMAFTGESINAQEALACGLVSRVVPDDQLKDAARDLASRIAANPPHALRMAKRLLRQARNQRLDEHLEAASAYQALAHTTADHREAISAFREKRKPVFTGQ